MKEEVVKLFLDKIQRLGAHPKHYGKTNVFEFDMIVEYPLKKLRKNEDPAKERWKIA